MRRAAAAALLLAACGDNSPAAPDRFCDSWHQWGGNSAHNGTSCSAGQALETQLADVVIDPFAAKEEIDAGGDLVIHYQSPLVVGDSVYVMGKAGTYTPCEPDPKLPFPNCNQPDELYRLTTQTWLESKYSWQDDGTLALDWTFETGWKPPPHFGFEPMFQPVIVGANVALPGASGSVWILDANGHIVRHVTPFASDPDVYVAGALATQNDYIYYNVVALDHDMPFMVAARSWLVAVAPDGHADFVDYSTLAVGSPAANEGCYSVYDVTKYLTFPPLDDAGNPLPPPGVECGPQVPGLNSAPAFARDGTMYVVSHAQFDEAYSYLIAIDPSDLSTKWARSLRDLVHDGCGVNVTCTDGAPAGVDPYTGLPPAMEVDDESSSSPVVLADGTVIYGAIDNYNFARGHLLHFDRGGHFLGTYDFGWDTTPAVAGDRIVMKDNHYIDPARPMQFDPGPYYLTALDENMNVLWQFQSTQMDVDHANGFEWCINAPAIDRDGTMYANSEDGHLYAITTDGTLRDRFFLGKAEGAAYTPVVLDHVGRVYALNDGHMYVIGAR
jgi:outer membrane protein assembly factor BamB